MHFHLSCTTDGFALHGSEIGAVGGGVDEVVVAEVGAQRAVGVAGDRVLGDTDGRSEHSAVNQNVFVRGEGEHIVAVAADLGGKLRQSLLIWVQVMEQFAALDAHHDLGVAGGSDGDGAVLPQIVHGNAKCGAEPFFHTFQRLHGDLPLCHADLVVTVFQRQNVNRQDAGPGFLQDGAGLADAQFQRAGVVGGDGGMTADRHLAGRSEEAHMNVAVPVAAVNKGGLGVIQLAGDLLHLHIRESVGIGNNARRIAAEAFCRKSVDLVDSIGFHDSSPFSPLHYSPKNAVCIGKLDRLREKVYHIRYGDKFKYFEIKGNETCLKERTERMSTEKSTKVKKVKETPSKWKIIRENPQLKPIEGDIQLRMDNYERVKKSILAEGQQLKDFANGHLYYGFHQVKDGWTYREWAPGADEMYLCGDFNNWDRRSCPLTRKENGNWEVFLEGKDALKDGQRVMAIVVKNGVDLDRIPAYAKYVVQDKETIQWSAVIYAPKKEFKWTDAEFSPMKNLYIYECHIGMAQEEPSIGTYTQFKENVLPRIKKLGYNTIQIMAVMEHPYYASFGYQVCNFFAASSRFGKPEELKDLINTAHEMGIAVLLDVVHSHCAPNSREGLNEFDGTSYQYFHDGARGNHPAWGTKCFDYNKKEVIHFLLSNLKFWQEEYHFDGFRFDGVTSMLYHNHGLGANFGPNETYFSLNTDTEAVTYLQLASELAKQVNPNAILIAEDMSAMPGMCLPIEDGGIGFDYRLSMGVPDLWIKLLKEQRDEDWDLGKIWAELTSRRPHEKVIGYVESHDQALVGDKTIMFRLCDQEMYWGMEKSKENMVVERGVALHKLLRLLTMSLGGEGYLTFMGNEFGHPEWIDFPREGNGWSYHYCRRQWSLADNGLLRYEFLNNFEIAMIELARKNRVFNGKIKMLGIDHERKVMMYQRGVSTFLFNFHPTESYSDFFVPMGEQGDWVVQLSSDDEKFGGQNRVATDKAYSTFGQEQNGQNGFKIYLPSRTAVVLKKKK